MVKKKMIENEIPSRDHHGMDRLLMCRAGSLARGTRPKVKRRERRCLAVTVEEVSVCPGTRKGYLTLRPRPPFFVDGCATVGAVL